MLIISLHEISEPLRRPVQLLTDAFANNFFLPLLSGYYFSPIIVAKMPYLQIYSVGLVMVNYVKLLNT